LQPGNYYINTHGELFHAAVVSLLISIRYIDRQ
jgi:hypothetical protein